MPDPGPNLESSGDGVGDYSESPRSGDADSVIADLYGAQMEESSRAGCSCQYGAGL